MTPRLGADTGLVQIGVMAERTGLSPRTVRYWEELGLLQPSTRTSGGFRLYGQEQEDRLRILKTMKPLGFTLDEMRDLIELLDEAAVSKPASRRALVLRERVNGMRHEIALRRAALLDQVEATTHISKALDAAVGSLS
jgi:MerR family transcriptional regulator, copper efflux regulator